MLSCRASGCEQIRIGFYSTNTTDEISDLRSSLKLVRKCGENAHHSSSIQWRGGVSPKRHGCTPNAEVSEWTVSASFLKSLLTATREGFELEIEGSVSRFLQEWGSTIKSWQIHPYKRRINEYYIARRNFKKIVDSLSITEEDSASFKRVVEALPFNQQGSMTETAFSCNSKKSLDAEDVSTAPPNEEVSKTRSNTGSEDEDGVTITGISLYMGGRKTSSKNPSPPTSPYPKTSTPKNRSSPPTSPEPEPSSSANKSSTSHILTLSEYEAFIATSWDSATDVNSDPQTQSKEELELAFPQRKKITRRKKGERKQQNPKPRKT